MTKEELQKYIEKLLNTLKVARENDIIIREVSFIRRTGKTFKGEDLKMFPEKLLGVKINNNL